MEILDKILISISLLKVNSYKIKVDSAKSLHIKVLILYLNRNIYCEIQIFKAIMNGILNIEYLRIYIKMSWT